MSSLDALYASHPVLAGERSVRVFEVEAANIHDADRTLPRVIRGGMKVIRLDQRPRFSALSYVWGSYSTPPNQVLCDGHIINVTTNCWAALSQLRRSFGALSIWVDAICINQENDREKESQIPLMRDIYALADFAYIWLGPGNPKSDQAIDYLSTSGFQDLLEPRSGIHYRVPHGSAISWKAAWRMSTKNLSHGLYLWMHGELGIIDYITSYFKACFTVPDSCIKSEALEDFFSRDWASRVWTLQEIVLAANPVVCCGTRILSWRSVIYAVAYLEHSSQHMGIYIPEANIGVWKRMVLLWCYVNPVYATHQVATNSVTLRTFLPEYFEFLDRCVFRRRIVAIIIGVLTNIFLVVFGHWVNYRMEDAIASVIWFIIYFIPILIIFFSIGVLFFWVWIDPIFRAIAVPLLSWKPASNTLLDHISLRGAIIQELFSRNATNNKDKSFGLFSIFRRLGLQLDSPDYTKSLCQIYTELFRKILLWNQSLDMLMHVGVLKDGYPSWLPDWTLNPRLSWFDPATKLKRDEGLYFATRASLPAWNWRSEEKLAVRGFIVAQILECSERFQFDGSSSVANGGWFGLTMIMKDHEISTFLHDMRQVWHFSQFGEPVLTGYQSVDSNMPEPTERSIHSFSDGPNGLYRQQMYNDLREKRRILFRTSVPTRVTAGNCPEQARVGDLIGLVSGIPVPLVLRPEGDCYKLIGPAEVDGLMKGELWDTSIEEDLGQIVLV